MVQKRNKGLKSNYLKYLTPYVQVCMIVIFILYVTIIMLSTYELYRLPSLFIISIFNIKSKLHFIANLNVSSSFEIYSGFGEFRFISFFKIKL